MAHTTSSTVIGPGDGPHVTITDDLEMGATVTLAFKRGEDTTARLIWNNGVNDGPIDTVNAFVQWLDMVAAETKEALNDRLHGVGEEGPF
jgi:hypothetical protein